MECKDLVAIITERKIDEPPIQVAFPEVSGVAVAEQINQRIQKLVKQMMLEMGAQNEDLLEMIGTDEVTLNQKGVLSIKFGNFSFIKFQAHPWNIQRALTFDLKTAQVASLADLFKIGSNYRLIISNEIKRQIKERQIPLITDLIRINDDQEYYLTEKALVVFFQRATIAPSVAGIIEFPISYNLLTNVIDPQGLLARITGKC